MKFIYNTLFYVISYLLLMVPTYVLPYFGSNSSVVNAISTAVGLGPTPQWWMHAWCLVMLILLTWLRGSITGKPYLVAFAVVAAVFDMVPGLSMIPLVPTIMHVLAIILGASAALQTNEEEVPHTPKATILVAAAITGIAVLGSVIFLTSQQFKSKPSSPAAPTQTEQPLEQKAQKSSVKPAIPAPPSPLPTSSPEPASPKAPMTPKPNTSAPVKTPAPNPAPKPQTEAPKKETKEEVRYIRLND